ncbi:MAG: 30S ribosomal protein S17 [Phycisphaerae bacterium]
MRQGVVTSDKRDKTIRVVVDSSTRHPLYGKFIRRRTVLQVHDEKNEAGVGDLVEVMSCRPISKTKCWRLKRIIKPAPAGR